MESQLTKSSPSTTQEKFNEFGFFTGDEVYKVTPKIPLIEGILYDKDVAFLTAPPKTGKSILLLQLLCSLTTGAPLFGTFHVSRKCRVLLIQTEGDRGETAERLLNMKKGLKIDDTMWTLCNLPGMAMNDDAEFGMFVNAIQTRGEKYDVIIIDPLYTTLRGSMSDPKEVTAWINNARKLRGMFNCAMIVATHPPKDSMFEGQKVSHDTPFGSQFWSGYMNQNLVLTMKVGYHTLTTPVQRSNKIVDKLDLVLIEPSPLMFTLREENMIASEASVIKVLRDRGALEMRLIEKYSGLSRATTYRAVGMLRDKNKVSRDSDGRVFLVPVSPEECL